jgi:SAM-dependent methyltransferase
MLRSKEEWDSMYRSGDIPWDAARPDPHLVDLVVRKVIGKGRLYEIGCGTGNEAIYLGTQGYYVKGIDISEIAIKEAQRRLRQARITSGNIDFQVGDFLQETECQPIYDFILDRRCFHFFHSVERDLYIQKVGCLLAEGGHLVQIVSSDLEPGKNRYHFSARNLIDIFDRRFHLRKMDLVVLEEHAEKPISYLCIWKKK